jgi:hypothetical protein
MSGGSAKREIEMATSHGKAPTRESGAKGREKSPPHVKPHQSGDKKKMMKKSGLLRERLFIALHLRLGHAVRHF